MELLSCLTAFLCAFVLPLGAAVFMSIKRPGYRKPVLFGALTFIVFQALTRIPVLQLVLPSMPWYIIMNLTQPGLTALFLGATAGLFEEGGRYLVMKFLLKRNRSTLDAVAFGIGHGGVEAILMVGVSSLITLLTASGTVDAGLVFAGGVERISAMMCHVGWSVMVMKSVREEKLGWLLAAFILHTVLDTSAALAVSTGVGTWIIEGALLFFAALMLVFIVREFRKEEVKL